MAQNTLPSGINDLLSLAGRIHAGLETHGRWLKQIPASEFALFWKRLVETENAFAGLRSRKSAEARRFAAAGGEVLTATGNAAVKKQARDAAEKKLRREMRCVVLMLSAVLRKSDPRWLAFGLNRPDAKAPARRARRVECNETEKIEPLPSV